ncbi:DUF4266 domain-containing protein [Sulfurimonas sp. SAG-AH-194-L11]|nr:DUF4266 domain-containing protein [Sulfurimonas sp. SAG-AH-194-L11]MDF1876805.1 DUF4266 domain-containing protein [Sulfurimonas sp. SAG-AH-194-L11]
MKTLFLLVVLLLVSGCSESLVLVMPYEKEYFAQDKMSLSPIAERAEQEGHIFLIREASAGGESSFQGGCGCR